METNYTNRERMHEMQLKVIRERRLSVSARIGSGVLAGIGVLFVINFVHLGDWALPPDGDMSRKVSGSFWLAGLLFALAWTVLCAYLAVRGKLRLKVQPSLIAGAGAGMVFVYIIILTFAMEFAQVRMQVKMGIKPPPHVINFPEQLAIAVFFMLVLVGLYLILRVVCRVEYRSREKLLEIEYRLADLAERLDERQSH